MAKKLGYRAATEILGKRPMSEVDTVEAADAGLDRLGKGQPQDDLLGPDSLAYSRRTGLLPGPDGASPRRRYLASTRPHLEHLERLLVGASGQRRRRVLVACWRHGLLRPFNLSMRVMFATILRSDERRLMWLIGLGRMGHEDQVEAFWDQTLDYMVRGTDHTPGSWAAGGWSQEELDLFVGECRAAGIAV